MTSAKEMVKYCIQNKYEYGANENNCLKHFSIIENLLEADESVSICFMALLNYTCIFFHDGLCACAITNKHLIIAQNKMIGHMYKTITLSDINSITFKPKMLVSILYINAKTKTLKVAQIKNIAKEINEKIHSYITSLSQSNNNATTTLESKTKESSFKINDNSKKVLETKIETHHITGVSHYKENIMSLSYENDDYDLTKKEIVDNYLYDERIYQYTWDISKIELTEEPDNIYDANAVKVMFDDVLVGYIKKGSCSHIKKLLNTKKILSIDAHVGGGKYKYVYQDNETDNWIMDKSSTDLFISIDIKIKKE